MTVVVQVNGKLRDRLEVAPGAGQRGAGGARPAACRGWRAAVDGKQVVREVVVPDRLVNLVVK